MKILALESSAAPASCAVWEDGKILASSMVNIPLTHSQTLMPMVENMLKQAGLPLQEMDVLAVSAGPGSFTGIRIGVAAVKGMAFSVDGGKPCAGVSTLAALAQNIRGIGFQGVICPVMDARCGQVYTALFTETENRLERLFPDEAISIEELKKRLISFNKSVIMVGDGANLCYNTLQNSIPGLLLAPAHLRYQTAVGVAAEAADHAAEGKLAAAESLLPVYLRLPQAERERLKKQEEKRM